MPMTWPLASPQSETDTGHHSVNFRHSQNRTLDATVAIAARINSPGSLTSNTADLKFRLGLSYWPSSVMCPPSGYLGIGSGPIFDFDSARVGHFPIFPHTSQCKKVHTYIVKKDSIQHSFLRISWSKLICLVLTSSIEFCHWKEWEFMAQSKFN